MGETKYMVWAGEELIAENMTIETVLILVKGLFSEYWNEKSLDVSIQRMDYKQKREWEDE